jgi:hypothetical protein
MNSEYYNQIAKSTAHRKSRDDNKNFIFDNPEYLKYLVDISFNVKNENHYKACWILELICEEKMELFLPFLEDFCETLSCYKNDSAIRSISKICLFLSNSKKYSLTKNQEEKIIEFCLDCLISTNKAANAAYSMKALYQFSKNHDWLKEELKLLLLKDFSSKTAAHKAAAKDILKRLK